MKNLFEKITLKIGTTIREAAKYLEENDFDSSGKVVLYVIDENKKLLGSLMDVDIRRAIIYSSISPDMCITHIMNPSPRRIIQGQCVDSKTFQTWKRFQYIPIVNSEDILLGFKENYEVYKYPNKVIIMAGGLGTRLRPLTNDTPKPMLCLGSKPLLQEIIESFSNKGFVEFYISVNYKAQVIKDYFEDGKKFGVKIHYLEEEKQLGTCGSIKLAENFLNESFFLINGDILANIDYEKLLETHLDNKHQITLCTFPHTITIPYGVVYDSSNIVNHITEKPQYTYMINCGVYILHPLVISFIQPNQYQDMPTLIEKALKKNCKVGTFPINEWIDIGSLEDFYRAKNKIVMQGEKNEL